MTRGTSFCLALQRVLLRILYEDGEVRHLKSLLRDEDRVLVDSEALVGSWDMKQALVPPRGHQIDLRRLIFLTAKNKRHQKYCIDICCYKYF